MATTKRIDGGCYHIWRIADGGNGMFRIRRCFNARSTANTVAQRGVTGDRGEQPIALLLDNGNPMYMVRKCLPNCPCGPGRKEHNKRG